MRPVLIIDTSYVVFAKYYSTLTWYKNNITEDPDVEYIMQSPCFQNKFKTNFERCIKKLTEKFEVPPERVIFAKDCSKGSVWRRSLFQNYKDGRVQNSLFNREIFYYMYNTLLPGYVAEKGGIVIDNETAEADDIMAICKSFIRKTTDSEVVIISNDNDCIQLVDEKTQIFNLMLHNVGNRRGAMTPEQYLLCRIISGDRSDNIASIFSRCGMKTAMKMVTQKTREQIEEYVKANDSVEQYDKNRLLMDFAMIPDNIASSIEGKVQTWMQGLEAR